MKQRGRCIHYIALAFLVGGLLTLQVIGTPGKVLADDFTTRSVKMSNNISGATGVEYELMFTTPSVAPVGSVRLQLCANDPFPGTTCVAPVGLNMNAAQLIYQSGMTGFSLASGSVANELILKKTPGPGTPGASTYRFSGITNPTNAGTLYGRLETFASVDATGTSQGANGLAMAIMPSGLNVRLIVPPYLTFCVGQTIQPYDCSTATGNYIDFGILSPDKTSTAQTKLLIATNADFGYTIRAQGTTLLSGINAIDALTAPDVSRQGKSQFGLNLRANSTPNTGQDPSGLGVGAPGAGYGTANQYKFVSGDVLASNTHPDNYRMYTVSYIVNVTKQQPAGVYVTTLTYIALASF